MGLLAGWLTSRWRPLGRVTTQLVWWAGGRPDWIGRRLAAGLMRAHPARLASGARALASSGAQGQGAQARLGGRGSGRWATRGGGGGVTSAQAPDDVIWSARELGAG